MLGRSVILWEGRDDDQPAPKSANHRPQDRRGLKEGTPALAWQSQQTIAQLADVSQIHQVGQQASTSPWMAIARARAIDIVSDVIMFSQSNCSAVIDRALTKLPA